jgi:hypothetical protein
MRHPAWVLAYHGCDKTTGEAILSGEEDILPSNNNYDWLGSGAYFWENSYSRALDWAKFLKERPGLSKIPIKNPFVIGAIIDPGNCLDLSENSSLQILKEAHENLKSIFKSLRRKLPQNERGYPDDNDLVKRKLDCLVINFLHRMRRRRGQSPFHTVRCPFMEGDYLFEGSKIHEKTHLQWCVRNPKKHIWAYFRPRHFE